MAMSLGGGGRGGRRQRYRPLAEINVTPLVDVMLVLLIVFMVTAPLMSNAVNVDLPKVSTAPAAQDSDPLTITIDAQGQVYLQDEKVELSDLVAKLQAISQNDKDRRIFVRGDDANHYGRILQVMGTIVQGGFTKTALLSEAPAGVAPSGAAPSAPAAAPVPATPVAPLGAAAPKPGG